MSASQSLYEDVKGGEMMPEIFSLMKKEKRKKAELIQGCVFALAPEDQGQKNRAGIRTGKI